jgi:hypothetical protein
MTTLDTVTLELTNEELIAIFYALQDRTNDLQKRSKDTQRVDILKILERQHRATVDALAQVERTINETY